MPRVDPAQLPPAAKAAFELAITGVAIRRLRIKTARAAFPGQNAQRAMWIFQALTAEVEAAARVLDMPAARLFARGKERPLLLHEVERLLASKALVVDALRHVVRDGARMVSLERRPVLFALARGLGEAWPDDAPRGALLKLAFRAMHADESHRARLRVEIGRLRAVLKGMAR